MGGTFSGLLEDVGKEILSEFQGQSLLHMVIGLHQYRRYATCSFLVFLEACGLASGRMHVLVIRTCWKTFTKITIYVCFQLLGDLMQSVVANC